ncbi:Tetratricopeptide repeat protein [Poriferisphaera corsica]|uniref:Tetratricopeptide repeat protein n=1 Tax=Poriferisphaera corsica TaxID=2528020 RepID=A0A517YV78_9BACT|nr:hypothetical protein [Poriferisphaera corsica]QDU34120.1 Tetratricopeptide repeat protein [Poriferisphaera corsica]
MRQRVVMSLLLIATLFVFPSCIERPWNKPVPLSKIYSMAGRLAGQGKYDEALEKIDEAIQRVQAIKSTGSDGELTRYERAMPFYVKGNILFDMARYVESKEAYNSACRIDADHAEAWLGEAFANYKLADDEGAVRSLEKARQSFESRLSDVQIWSVKDRIERTFETKLNVAIITALMGSKDAAISQLHILGVAYPDLANTQTWIELIEQDHLLAALLKQDLTSSDQEEMVSN